MKSTGYFVLINNVALCEWFAMRWQCAAMCSGSAAISICVQRFLNLCHPIVFFSYTELLARFSDCHVKQSRHYEELYD